MLTDTSLVWNIWLAAIALVPIAQQFLRLLNRSWTAVPIAVLMFMPGLQSLAMVLVALSNEGSPPTRWKIVHLLDGAGLSCLFWCCVIALLYLGLWHLIEYLRKQKIPFADRTAERTINLKKPLFATFIVLLLPSVYLTFYTSLEDAVASNDVALAEKRLRFNLEGLGPNNGRIVAPSGIRFETFPLLPLAVESGNLEMISLLVASGAELNPEDWDQYLVISQGIFVTNTLFHAVEQDNKELIDFLIDLGADPTQGLLIRFFEERIDLMAHLLEKGADPEVARKLALDLVDRRPEFAVTLAAHGLSGLIDKHPS